MGLRERHEPGRRPRRRSALAERLTRVLARERGSHRRPSFELFYFASWSGSWISMPHFTEPRYCSRLELERITQEWTVHRELLHVRDRCKSKVAQAAIEEHERLAVIESIAAARIALPRLISELYYTGSDVNVIGHEDVAVAEERSATQPGNDVLGDATGLDR